MSWRSTPMMGEGETFEKNKTTQPHVLLSTGTWLSRCFANNVANWEFDCLIDAKAFGTAQPVLYYSPLYILSSNLFRNRVNSVCVQATRKRSSKLAEPSGNNVVPISCWSAIRVGGGTTTVVGEPPIYLFYTNREIKVEKESESIEVETIYIDE